MIFLSCTRGDLNRNRKISSQDVRDIRAAAEKGVPNKKLAEKYGIHVNTIIKIVRRQTWKSVE